ncbi:hypothetical protein C8J56DRAFT_1115948 [Mycena floridula]|nr:hypothetical protein C8J56DRAFT_1115948 [Mycena floridula]
MSECFSFIFQLCCIRLALMMSPGYLLAASMRTIYFHPVTCKDKQVCNHLAMNIEYDFLNDHCCFYPTFMGLAKTLSTKTSFLWRSGANPILLSQAASQPTPCIPVAGMGIYHDPSA